MNTIDPCPASRIGPSAACVQSIAENRFTSIVFCHRARSVSSARKAGSLQPALLTSTSIPPHSSTSRLTTRLPAPGSVRSACTTSASVAPRSNASERTLAACSASMSQMATRAPSSAKPCTMPRPILDPPPVTSTRAAYKLRSISALLSLPTRLVDDVAAIIYLRFKSSTRVGARMRVFKGLPELLAAEGAELGPSDWVVVDQARIDAFAGATGDHQWIHVDPQRAAAGPFGTTIAHGLLTLSLLPTFLHQLFRVE